MSALLDETGSLTSSTLASRLTKTFDLMGGAVAIDAGDASTMAALSASVDLLRAGDCDMMLCAAGQLAMSCASYASMADDGLLAAGNAAGPFDADAAGCPPGECVGVLLLKRLSDAERDGDRIRGIIRGIGVAREDSLSDSIAAATQSALRSAQVLHDDISVIEAVATGAAAIDNQEIAGLAKAYGQRDQPVWLSAASSQFGYTGGASGMASLFKASATLKNVAVPKLDRVRKPSAALADSRTLQLPTEKSALPAVRDDGRLMAGINSFSQFNLAYHVIIEDPTRVPRKRATNGHAKHGISQPGGRGAAVIADLDSPPKTNGSGIAHKTNGNGRLPAQHPLIDKILLLEPGKQLVARVQLDPQNDPFLAQHRFKGRPLMPAVAMFEALAEAALQLAGTNKRITGLRNVEMLNRLRFAADEPRTARIFAQQRDGDISCRFTCDHRNRRGDVLQRDKAYLQCVIESGDSVSPANASMPEQPAQWETCVYPDQNGLLWHGPAYRCLEEVAVDGREGWGRIVARSPRQLSGGGRPGHWLVDAGPIDACFYVCGAVLGSQDAGEAAIPEGIGHLQIVRRVRPNERCFIHARQRDRTEKGAIFDFTMYGEDSSAIVLGDGYRSLIVATQGTTVQ